MLLRLQGLDLRIQEAFLEAWLSGLMALSARPTGFSAV